MEGQSSMKIQEDRYLKARALVRGLKERHWPLFDADPNIVGAAFGQRHAHGEQTDEPALVIYVVSKMPHQFLPPSRLLPRRMYVGGECVEVDVVETGIIYAHSFTARERPAPQGVSVAHVAVTAGTIGAVVTDNTDSSQCILSNNHVLANINAGVIGDSIVQPGPFDGGVSPADDIATLKRFVTLNATGNTVDCALGQVIISDGVSPVVDAVKNNLMPVASPAHPAVGLLFAGSCGRTIMNPIDSVLSGLNISFPAGAGSTVAADIGMNVEKVGRTSEYTTSTIKEIDATVTIGYPDMSRTFDHQMTTAWMSDPGDSGSLICQGGAGSDINKCGCGTTSAASEVLGTDLREERVMAEVVRDKFIRQTRVGRFAVDVFFMNEDRLLDRFRATELKSDDVAFARKLFEKYRQQGREAFVQGEKSEERLTQQHMRDAKAALKRAQRYMSKDEVAASERLFELANKHGVGKNARELLALMNDEKLHDEVQEIASQVEFIRSRQEPC
jgi:hypothetical protein